MYLDGPLDYVVCEFCNNGFILDPKCRVGARMFCPYCGKKVLCDTVVKLKVNYVIVHSA